MPSLSMLSTYRVAIVACDTVADDHMIGVICTSFHLLQMVSEHVLQYYTTKGIILSSKLSQHDSGHSKFSNFENKIFKTGV